jgi:hypothetical protein
MDLKKRRRSNWALMVILHKKLIMFLSQS